VIPVAWLPLVEGFVRDGREGGLDSVTPGTVESGAGLQGMPFLTALREKGG